MDIITRAIEKKLHLYEDDSLPEQTWEFFHCQRKGKKVFIFGIGGGLEFYFRNCCNHTDIAGVLDNDKHKLNRKLSWQSAEAWKTEYDDLVIQSPDILKEYSNEEVIVLVSVINGYGSMIRQLKELKITNIFVLLIMEANRRKNLKVNVSENFVQIRRDYIDWCCQQNIENKKIVMRIGEYGGHARQITNALLKRRSDLDIIWLVHDFDEEAPCEVKLVCEKNWKRCSFEMETARIWLFDVSVSDYIRKRENQIYIQVKHWASITLKKFYLDDKTSCNTEAIREQLKRDGARMDYLFSGSEFDEMSCRSGFAFKGEAVRIGSARSDVLFNPTIRKKVLKNLLLNEKQCILLYAPTFRFKDYYNKKGMDVSLDMEVLRETLEDKFGGEWHILVRLHPLMDFEKSGLWESKYIHNVGNYSDSEELVAAADIMVTDYSSIMFELAFMKRPVFLYAPDYKEYTSEERGLWIDYNTLPFPRAESNEELHQCIAEFDREKYEWEVTNFLEKFGVHEDGHASERAAKFIIELIDKSIKEEQGVNV